MSIGCLQVIRQAIVGAVEIVAFVLDTEPQVPFTRNMKTMVVAEIVIQRITIAQFGFLEIAAESVGRLVRKKIV